MKTRIKELRAKYNLTQEDLAKKVGVRRETIVFLEQGKYNPSLKLAYDISKVLKSLKYRRPKSQGFSKVTNTVLRLPVNSCGRLQGASDQVLDTASIRYSEEEDFIQDWILLHHTEHWSKQVTAAR